MTLDTAIALCAIVLALLWPTMSHPVVRLTRQPSEPGAASTAPALAHTYGRGASVSDRTPYGAPLAFIEQAINSATDECIPWPYFVGRNGYGKVPVGGASRYAHRVVLERTAGRAPAPGMLAAHAPLICHNRACVNPRHLRWATPKQNMDDRLIDDTHHRGERHHGAKLTAVQVLAIFRDGRTHQAIADEYGVNRTTITMIKLGRTWGWLTHTSRAVA